MDYQKALLQVIKKEEESRILKCNEDTITFGLSLTKENIALILKTKEATLQELERVEFSSTIVEQMIRKFMDSLFITKYNYDSGR